MKRLIVICFALVCLGAIVLSPASADVISIASGDFYNDGSVDIAAVECSRKNCRILIYKTDTSDIYPSAGHSYRNHQNRKFKVQIAVDSIQRPDSIAAADFDADGYADLAISANESGVSWFKNNERGDFTFVASMPAHAPVLANKRRLTLRLNPDAIDDVVEIRNGELIVDRSAPSAIFIVNDAGDLFDADLNDGVCDVDTGTSGDQCSLRAALEQANVDAAMDAIEFNLPGAVVPTIGIGSALPQILNPVTIDGTTQTAGRVELQGVLAGPLVNGLDVAASNTLIRGLVLNRFEGDAIRISGGGNNIVEGNWIGIDSSGGIGLPNSGRGLFVDSCPNNTIGGTLSAARNVVSGNAGIAGIQITGLSSTGNTILGNYVGTNSNGTAAIGNSGDGILIESPDNTVGGIAAGSANVISGNFAGIRISGPNGSGNSVVGNIIGTDATGNLAIANANGILISNWGTDNTIGGLTATARNIVSGNGTGIVIINSSLNLVYGNFIGTNLAGDTALPNNNAGVLIFSSSGNEIGGDDPNSANIISGNDLFGVALSESGSTGNQIKNNRIGTTADGSSALSNGSHGIYIGNPAGTSAANTLIEANTIAYNNSDGIYVHSGANHQIISNQIYSNAGLGIDLGNEGVNQNDLLDSDSGSNGLQNYPVLNSASSTGGTTSITGTLNSSPNQNFTIEFYSSSDCDPSGYGEGESFLGSLSVLTGGAGNAAVNASFPVQLASGTRITATARNISGNTSEFSQCVVVGGGGGSNLFSDTFDDGSASDWQFTKGTWNVTNENLTGIVDRKGDAISPDFGGCSVCSFEANMGVQTPGGRVSLLAWLVDKRTLVEVRLMDDRDKILLVQKSGGFKQAKASVSVPISAGTTYNLRVQFDGANFQVYLNGVLTLTEPAGSIPSGNAGFRVKSVTGTAVTGYLEDIVVQQ